MNASPSPQHRPTATSAVEGLSLRDRKKAETRHAIARATVEMILEQGVDLATITSICERAGVSQRTFHNYFPHREAAVMDFLHSMMDWLCGEVETTDAGPEPLELAQSLTLRFYNNPNDELYSMSAIGQLASVILGLDLDILEDMITRDARAATNTPAQCHAGKRFLVPLVNAIRRYYDNRVDMFTATMLVQTLLMVCHSVWELSQDPLLAGDRTPEDMVTESYRLLQSGFSLS